MQNNKNYNTIIPAVNDKRIKNKAIQDDDGNYFALRDGRANWGKRKNYTVDFAKVFYSLGAEELKKAENSGTLKYNKKTGEVYDTPEARKYFLKHLRMSECSLRLGYKISADNAVTLFNAHFCRDRLCPICMWRLSRRVAWETYKIIEHYTAENPNMIPIMLGLTVRNPKKGDLNKMLDVLCHRKSGAWQLLSKYLGRRGLKDYIRTVEITYNHKENSWHPHIHGLFFVPKEYFSRDNKNYISQKQLAEYWQRVCKLDYKPIVDIRRVYDKNKPKERIKLDTDIKAMDLTGAIFETAKYCVKPLKLFSETLNDYDDYDGNIGGITNKIIIKEVVRELSEALAGRRLRALGGELKKIAKRLKFDDDENKKDLLHKDENGTAEAIWEEIYEYVFEDKEYYLTAREAVEPERPAQADFSDNDKISEAASEIAVCDGHGEPADTAVGRLKSLSVYSENFIQIRAVSGEFEPVRNGADRCGVEGQQPSQVSIF